MWEILLSATKQGSSWSRTKKSLRKLASRSNDPAQRWIRRIDHPGLFLTYDDGPDPVLTPQVLDVLREFKGSATFFVTGQSLDKIEAPAILKRILAEGHTLGNHGQLHRKDAYPDFETGQLRIEAACGAQTRIFRAPFGLEANVFEYLKRDRRALAIHWTQHFEDWLPVDLDKVARQIPEVVKPGTIVLLHDGTVAEAICPDRSTVAKITEMIATECRRKSIPLVGLASIYPGLHRVSSGRSKSIGATLRRWFSGPAVTQAGGDVRS